MQRVSVEHEAVRRGERAIEPASGLVVATEPGADQERADALVDERIVVERFVDERVWPATLTTKQRDITRTGAHRSEEHTSELQSLMRISYAVFCLKKKNITNVEYKHIRHYHASKLITI